MYEALCEDQTHCSIVKLVDITICKILSEYTLVQSWSVGNRLHKYWDALSSQLLYNSDLIPSDFKRLLNEIWQWKSNILHLMLNGKLLCAVPLLINQKISSWTDMKKWTVCLENCVVLIFCQYWKTKKNFTGFRDERYDIPIYISDV